MLLPKLENIPYIQSYLYKKVIMQKMN